jgi:hypothetical protein
VSARISTATAIHSQPRDRRIVPAAVCTPTVISATSATMASRFALPTMPWIAPPVNSSARDQANASGMRSASGSNGGKTGSTGRRTNSATASSNTSDSPSTQRRAVLSAQISSSPVRHRARKTAAAAVNQVAARPASVAPG